MSAIDRRTPQLTPEALGREPVPSEPYRSPAWFELEREHIFRRVWLCVGREEEAPRAGDFVVKEVEVCGASVLIVRGQDAELRAFHNVCSHRSNKLVWETRGHASKLVCRYHSWSYALTGELRGVPDAGMFFELDKASCSLSPIHLECWNGFIFLNFAPAPVQTLRDYLGGLGHKLDGYPFARFSAHAVIGGVLEANWKASVDAFQEAYHLGVLHRQTIGPQFTSGLNPFGRLISAQFHGPHRSGAIWGNREFRPRPTELKAFGYAIPIGGGGHDQPVQDVLPATINPEGDPNWAIELNAAFPNVIFFVSKQGYLTHSFWPITHERTRWEASMHFAPATSARQLFAQQFSLCQARDTFIEDSVNLRHSQQGLQSGARDVLHFQDNEVFPRHQYRVVEEYIRQGEQAASGC